MNRIFKGLFRAGKFSEGQVSKDNRYSVWRYAYWTPMILVLADYFYNIKVVSGRSMQPTLNPDSSPGRDVALFDRYAIHTRRIYQRGDIVALTSPENPERVLVKRIIALGGDRVKTLPPYKDAEVTVPPGHAWIEGDEPFHSDDSNRFGPVSLSLIDSRMVCVIWPPSRFGQPQDPSVTLRSLAPSDYHGRRHALADIERAQRRTSRVMSGTNTQ